MVSMYRKYKGFSLIELMVVVAIIGILASIAIPAYDKYIVRSKASHISNTIAAVRKALVEYRSLNGVFPNDISDVLPSGITGHTGTPNPPALADLKGYASVGTAVNVGTNVQCIVSTFNVVGHKFFGKASPGDVNVIYQIRYDVSGGKTTETCTYNYPSVAAVKLTDLIPGCTYVDVNTAPNYEYTCT